MVDFTYETQKGGWQRRGGGENELGIGWVKCPEATLAKPKGHVIYPADPGLRMPLQRLTWVLRSHDVGE